MQQLEYFKKWHMGKESHMLLKWFFCGDVLSWKDDLHATGVLQRIGEHKVVAAFYRWRPHHTSSLPTPPHTNLTVRFTQKEIS